MAFPRRIVVIVACNIVALGAAFACSTFDADSNTTDGTDGASDGGLPDVVGPDGGSVDVDAGPLSPCVGAEHLFCADFDENPFNRGWDDQYFTNDASATLALDKSRFVSPPSSLHAHLDDFGSSLEATLIEKVRFAPQSLEASLSLRVNMPATGTSSPLSFVVGLDGGGESLFVTMKQEGNNVELALSEVHHNPDGGLDIIQSHPSTKPIPIESPAAWHRLKVTATLTSITPLSGDVSLYVDGALGVSTPVSFGAPMGTPGILVQVGIRHFSNIYPAQDVNIDDVIIDATP